MTDERTLLDTMDVVGDSRPNKHQEPTSELSPLGPDEQALLHITQGPGNAEEKLQAIADQQPTEATNNGINDSAIVDGIIDKLRLGLREDPDPENLVSLQANIDALTAVPLDKLTPWAMKALKQITFYVKDYPEAKQLLERMVDGLALSLDRDAKIFEELDTDITLGLFHVMKAGITLDSKKNACIDTFRKNKDKIISSLADEKGTEFVDFLEYAVTPQDNPEETVKAILGALTSEEVVYPAQIMAELGANPNKNLRNVGEQVIDTFLQETCDLNGSELREAWSNSLGNDREQAYRLNLQSLIKIEREMPGAAKLLYNEYGISCLGKWPEDVLMQQYRDHIAVVENHDQGQIQKPYILIATARNSYDAALYQTFTMFGSFRSNPELSEKVSPKIIECARGGEFKTRVRAITRTFGGETNKAKALIIKGHGTPEGVSLSGSRYPDSKLHAEDVIEIIDTLEDEAPILFTSCSTGVEQGIAQQISETGHLVIGPDKDTSTNQLDIYEQDGHIALDAQYLYNATVMRYKNGKRT